MIAHVSLPFWGALRARTAAHGLLRVPARRFRTNRRTNRACEIEEGLLLAEAPGLMVPVFRRLSVRWMRSDSCALEIVFGPEDYFGARKGSPPPHPRSAKPLWKPPCACPRP